MATKKQSKKAVGYPVYLSKMDPTTKQMGFAKRVVFAAIDGRNLAKHLACMKTIVNEINYLSNVVQDIFHEQ